MKIVNLLSSFIHTDQNPLSQPCWVRNSLNSVIIHLQNFQLFLSNNANSEVQSTLYIFPKLHPVKLAFKGKITEGTKIKRITDM